MTVPDVTRDSSVVGRARLRQVRELAFSLARRELKSRYHGTILGYVWSLATPLTLVVVYSIVFGLIVDIQPERGNPSGLDSYAIWLLCGLLAWTFFARTVTSGMASLVANPGLVTNVYLPRVALVLGASLASFATWVLEMSVLLIALAVVGAHFVQLLPLVVLFGLLLCLFGTGLALALSVLNVRFRDTQHVVGVGLQLLFFLSPVIYPVSMVEARSRDMGDLVAGLRLTDIFIANPLTHFIAAFRTLLYDNAVPSMSTVLVCLGFAGVTLLGGFWFFTRQSPRIAERM